MYRSARNKFTFHEENEINLGFSKSQHGAGWGKKLSDQFLKDAHQIIKKGSKDPEIFHLAGLFEEKVGPDRISDMIATIIEPQIIQYTLRIQNELNINSKTRPHLSFLLEGLVQNPYKDHPILLLPEDILHELPIAECWEDIDRVVSENEIFRQEISKEVGRIWKKWGTSKRKAYVKNHIFMNPEICAQVIVEYRQQELAAYNFKENEEYLADLLLKKIKRSESFKHENSSLTSLDAAREIINLFKDWVENNRGWDTIQNISSKKCEKAVQRYLHLSAKYYVKINNFDLTCESDMGRGPVDFKLSRGNDKTLAEVKLSSNGQYLHGYETQLEEYGKAEGTSNQIYVFVDLGNPGKRKSLIELHERTKQSGKPCPELIIIDAQPKKSASVYEKDSCGQKADEELN